MTLAIVFKGTEGIVLAADSRVTLQFQIPGTQLLTPAHFDNATKLLKVGKQKYVAAVTFGEPLDHWSQGQRIVIYRSLSKIL
jgi:hypothetical protein